MLRNDLFSLVEYHEMCSYKAFILSISKVYIEDCEMDATQKSRERKRKYRESIKENVEAHKRAKAVENERWREKRRIKVKTIDDYDDDSKKTVREKWAIKKQKQRLRSELHHCYVLCYINE